MPQMAPYNWLILFMMFNYILFIFLSHIHFMKKNFAPAYKPINYVSFYFPFMW